MKKMTKMEALDLIDTLKANYPNPQKFKYSFNQEEDYCIGGAFCRHLEDDINYFTVRTSFPSAAALRKQILKLNPLAVDYSLSFNIISANDSGNYERAWRMLYKALTFGYEHDNEQCEQSESSQVRETEPCCN